MNQYTLYCTEEQTKKALELGAPIDFRNGDRPFISVDYLNEKGQLLCHNYDLPTAEQMIGWLEDTFELQFLVGVDHDDLPFFHTYCENDQVLEKGNKTSRKEATLAAIDAALEYLANQKNK